VGYECCSDLLEMSPKGRPPDQTRQLQQIALQTLKRKRDQHILMAAQSSSLVLPPQLLSLPTSL
jgi:hypothetical protein